MNYVQQVNQCIGGAVARRSDIPCWQPHVVVTGAVKRIEHTLICAGGFLCSDTLRQCRANDCPRRAQ